MEGTSTTNKDSVGNSEGRPAQLYAVKLFRFTFASRSASIWRYGAPGPDVLHRDAGRLPSHVLPGQSTGRTPVPLHGRAANTRHCAGGSLPRRGSQLGGEGFSRAPAGKRTTSPHRRTTSKASGRSELKASPVRWALITVALYREDRVDALFGSVEMCGRYYRLEDADGL